MADDRPVVIVYVVWHLESRLDYFFDAADIPSGTRFAEFMTEYAGSLPALLAIQTDSYASREWCRLEVLVTPTILQSL